MEDELQEVPRSPRCKDDLVKFLMAFPSILILEDFDSSESEAVSFGIEQQVEESLQLWSRTSRIDCEMPEYSWRYRDVSRIVESDEIQGARPDGQSIRQRRNLNCLDSNF
jgi:hypothetical protein